MAAKSTHNNSNTTQHMTHNTPHNTQQQRHSTQHRTKQHNRQQSNKETQHNTHHTRHNTRHSTTHMTCVTHSDQTRCTLQHASCVCLAAVFVVLLPSSSLSYLIVMCSSSSHAVAVALPHVPPVSHTSHRAPTCSSARHVRAYSRRRASMVLIGGAHVSTADMQIRTTSTCVECGIKHWIGMWDGERGMCRARRDETRRDETSVCAQS